MKLTCNPPGKTDVPTMSISVEYKTIIHRSPWSLPMCNVRIKNSEDREIHTKHGNNEKEGCYSSKNDLEDMFFFFFPSG